MFIVPSGPVGGGKYIHCAKWRIRLRETYSLCQVAQWVVVNMSFVPSGALGGGKYVHCSEGCEICADISLILWRCEVVYPIIVCI